jgi:Flp pilus assembly pilin Flp
VSLLEAITENSLIPIGVACGIIIAVASYTAWLSAKFSSLSDKIMSQGTDLRSQVQEIKFMLSERFTKEEFRRWERGFFQANPSLKAPEDAP